MNPSDQQARPPTQTGARAAPGGASAQSGGGGDMLDKGVNFLEQKSGHEQKPGTTEKISDGLRSGFKKMTGKDVPIKDQEYK